MNKKKKMTLFFIVVALWDLSASFVHPVTPTLFKDLQLKDYMFGVALACMMAANFLFSPFWGKISGYISSRKTLLISCMGYALGQVFFALSRTQLQFILARTFAGVFCGGIFVGILNYIVNESPGDKARNNNLVLSATLQTVFNSLGYFVGGMLGEINVYVAVYAQTAALCACGLLFLAVCEKDNTIPAEAMKPGLLVKEANPFGAFVQGRSFMTLTLAFLFGMVALQNLSQTAFDQSFNYYVIDQIGMSTGYNGTIKFVMGVVTMLANATVCVWLMNRTDGKKSIIYVLLAGTVCMAGVLGFRQLVPFLIVSILFYAISSVSIPMMQRLAADESGKEGRDSNLMMGFYNSLQAFGGIIGALVAGFTYVVSPRAPFVCCTVGFFAAALCAVTYRIRVSSKSKKRAENRLSKEYGKETPGWKRS